MSGVVKIEKRYFCWLQHKFTGQKQQKRSAMRLRHEFTLRIHSPPNKKKPSSCVAGGVPINRLAKGNACDVHITGAMVQCLERPHCSR